MNITIHAGHNPDGKVGSGAVDFMKESTEARTLVKRVEKCLKCRGVKVTDCTVDNGTSQSDVLVKICDKANKADRDADLSVHFNASSHSKADGKTTGFEVLLYDDKNARMNKLATRLCKIMERQGFRNRGVKYRQDLYFLKHTKKPALLMEICFVTDEDDYKLYKVKEELLAFEIARVIATA